MGITRGQLKKLGFKTIKTKPKYEGIFTFSKEDLYYEIKPYDYFLLRKNKTVIYHCSLDLSNQFSELRTTPLVHLDETGFEEMLNFLMNLKNSSVFKLKNQIEDF